MIAFFDPEDIVQTMGVQGLDVGGIRTQAVFSDNEFEVRVVLAQPGNEPFRGIPFTVIFVRAIVFHQSVQASTESLHAYPDG